MWRAILQASVRPRGRGPFCVGAKGPRASGDSSRPQQERPEPFGQELGFVARVVQFYPPRTGALASKICGAGGGGCMITFVRQGKREAVEAALEDAGATVLPFRIAREGLTVKEA